MAQRGDLSIIIVPEGSDESRTYHLSAGRIRLLKWLGGALAITVVFLASTWWLVASRAALADDLQLQVDSLTARQVQTDGLLERLSDLESRYNHLRGLFGSVDQPESDLWLPRAGTGGGPVARTEDSGPSEPRVWPLTVPGFITQPLIDGVEGEHPGIDIAVPTDSYIRASGGGTVVDAADDPVYGLFVLIDHGQGIRTLYGHASMLLVRRGQSVREGEVIALSGSTGRSTAPHLHFEIQVNGTAVDPLSMVQQP